MAENDQIEFSDIKGYIEMQPVLQSLCSYKH